MAFHYPICIKNQKPESGYFLLAISLLLVLISYAFLQVSFLYRSSQQISQLQFEQLKASYLAHSGFSLAKTNWNSIQTVATLPSKENFMKNPNTPILLPYPNEGTLYLVKDSTQIMSIGRYQSAWVFFSRNYTKTDTSLSWGLFKQL